MASFTIEPKGNIFNNSSQICRLCMSKESLSDMYKEYGLHQWIEDYLSIMVSVEDNMSKLICTVCRTRLTEFHQFRSRCQDVQGILLSMNRTSGIETEHTGEQPVKDPVMSKVEQSDLPVQCEVCYKVFKTNKQLFNHNRIHRPKRHKCIQCGKSFVRREHLDKHIKIHVEKIEEKAELQQQTDSTKFCVAIPTADIELSAEEPYHPRLPVLQPNAIKLEPPDNDLTDEAHLDHQEIHTEGRLAEDLEDMIDIEEMKVENRSDSDEVTPSDAPKDTISTKGKSVEKLFKCDLCPKSFRLKCRLGFHKQYTHGTKQHECPICGRPFGFRHHMEQHIRTHESIQERQRLDTEQDNSRLFQCDLCQKTFKTQKALAHHKRYRHGPKTHECHICGFQFTLACRLAKHLRSHSRRRESKEDFQKDRAIKLT